MDPEDQTDIQSVRQWCKASHVEDLDALVSFATGRGVFDVSAGGMKLELFLQQHSLAGRCYRNSFTGLCGNRPIYMAFKTESVH
jgi:hypothetical protein